MNTNKMTFTAIDFETSNYERTRACQIGIAVVENGKITEEYSSYIKADIPEFSVLFRDQEKYFQT
jgi:DNA polymerase III subunit epsilon